jgi:hypothetical protein
MTNLSIKIGQVSFDWETDIQLSVDDINQLIDRLEALPGWSPGSLEEKPSHLTGAEITTTGPQATPQLHVNSIASALSATSGPDVAIAAAAYLQIVKSNSSFTRQELLAAMKEATKFYNANMSGNLTKILNNLVGSKINQVGQNQYSLVAAEFSKLESQLAQLG